MQKLMIIDRVSKALRGGSRGFSLVEVLIALAILGTIAAAFVGSLATASQSAALADVRTNAESLARSQMEYVKSQSYISYNVSDHQHYDVKGEPPYTIDLVVEPINPQTGEPHDKEEGVFVADDGLQRITVTVSHEDRRIFTLIGYNRRGFN